MLFFYQVSLNIINKRVVVILILIFVKNWRIEIEEKKKLFWFENVSRIN